MLPNESQQQNRILLYRAEPTRHMPLWNGIHKMHKAGDAITKYDRMKLEQKRGEKKKKKGGALEGQMIMTVTAVWSRWHRIDWNMELDNISSQSHFGRWSNVGNVIILQTDKTSCSAALNVRRSRGDYDIDVMCLQEQLRDCGNYLLSANLATTHGTYVCILKRYKSAVSLTNNLRLISNACLQ